MLFVVFLVFVGTYYTRSGRARAAVSPQLIIYTGENFTGHSYVVTGTLLDMPPGKDDGPESDRYGWNDSVRSVKVVSGTWRLYQHGRCNTNLDETPVEDLDLTVKHAENGWSCLVSADSAGPTEYPTGASGGWATGEISSIELVSERNLPDWAVMKPRRRVVPESSAGL